MRSGKWLKLLVIPITAVVIVGFGALSTRDSHGCCMLGKKVEVGFPFPYKTVRYQEDNTTVDNISYSDDAFVINGVAWVASILVVSFASFMLINEGEQHA